MKVEVSPFGTKRLDFTEEIERGAKWLDEYCPGWDDRIDVGTLDMTDPYRCVLGQTWMKNFGTTLDIDGTSGYSTGVRYAVDELGMDVGFFTAGHGFWLNETAVEVLWGEPDSDDSDDDDYYDNLTSLWWSTLAEQWIDHIHMRRMSRSVEQITRKELVTA